MKLIWLVLLAPSTASADDDPRENLAPGLVGAVHQKVGGKVRRLPSGVRRNSPAHCLDCHRGIESLIAEPESFHARAKSRLCIDCHTDHRGAADRW